MRQLFLWLHALVCRRLGADGGGYDFDRDVMPRPFLSAPPAEQFRLRRFDAVHYSSVFDWATRLTLASVFTLLVVGNVSWIIQAVNDGEHHASDHLMLNIAARASSALFVALAAATTLSRLPPIRKAAGIEPRVAALLGTFLLTALAMLPRKEISLIALAISCSFVVVGMLSSFVVLSWLGKAFSIMAEARRLVTHGPYRYVRHPLYVCEEIAVIGIFIQVMSPTALMIFVLHAVCQIRRMLNEERVLQAAFPEYENYARRTPRLIPAGWFGKPIG
jgi:protein-S-isoprenylcysteine O-methyltransferase Ste14